MYSFTNTANKRTEFKTYGEFSAAKEEIQKAGRRWVSYYDKHGDTHVCLFTCIWNTVKCCGVRETIPNDLDALGEYEAHHQAARIAKRENYAEFLGWTI